MLGRRAAGNVTEADAEDDGIDLKISTVLTVVRSNEAASKQTSNC